MNLKDIDKLAEKLHSGQYRKYTGEEYIVHPRHVLDIYRNMEALIGGASYEMRAICLLHDTIEDTDTTYNDLARQVGIPIADGVLALTNTYTKERFPYLNREERSILESHRISKIHPTLQVIKICDMIVNIVDLSKSYQQLNNPNIEYINKYIQEKEYCVSLMTSKFIEEPKRMFGLHIETIKFHLNEVTPDEYFDKKEESNVCQKGGDGESPNANSSQSSP